MSIILDNPHFSAIRNPAWANAEHTLITCEVNFIHVGFEEWTPFCADPNDYMPYSKIIFARVSAGEFGTVAEIVDPTAGIEDNPVEYGSQTWREVQAVTNNPIPKVVV